MDLGKVVWEKHVERVPVDCWSDHVKAWLASLKLIKVEYLAVLTWKGMAGMNYFMTCRDLQTAQFRAEALRHHYKFDRVLLKNYYTGEQWVGHWKPFDSDGLRKSVVKKLLEG